MATTDDRNDAKLLQTYGLDGDEAAPAACLQFAGNAATTGLASVLTTATIIKITAVAVGAAVLGVATAYVATRDNPP